jgi:hypothetical protein
MHEPLVIADAMAATLSEAGSSFEANELAYLALTSKVELPIRDRVAWHLQLTLGDDYVVSREWRRADIAVLRQNVPLVQVEAKAMYECEVQSQVSREADIGRAQDGVARSRLRRILASTRYARRRLNRDTPTAARCEVQQRDPRRAQ